MKIPTIYTLNAIVRAYINVRIFIATFILTIMVFGLWHAEKSSKDHLYCKEGQECYTLKLLYFNPFGEDYIGQWDYELLPYKVVYLYDEKKKRKVGDSWFDSRYSPLEAYFEVPPGEYTIRLDNQEALPFETVQVKEDVEIYLPYKDPLEESNLIMDVVLKRMKEKEKEEREKNEQ